MFHRIKLQICLFFLYFFRSAFITQTQYRSWKTSGALPCIISGANGHLSRTDNIPKYSRITSSHERLQSPCWDPNPQRRGPSGLKSTTLITLPQTPPVEFKQTFIFTDCKTKPEIIHQVKLNIVLALTL
jgi:hypothetical protein